MALPGFVVSEEVATVIGAGQHLGSTVCDFATWKCRSGTRDPQLVHTRLGRSYCLPPQRQAARHDLKTWSRNRTVAEYVLGHLSYSAWASYEKALEAIEDTRPRMRSVFRPFLSLG